MTPEAAYWAAARAYVQVAVPIRHRRSSRAYELALQEVTQMVAETTWLRSIVDAAWVVATREKPIPDE